MDSSQVVVAPGLGRAGSVRHGVVLFDGTCAFCERSVLFIVRRDPEAYFRFGASQSPEAAAWLKRSGMAGLAERSLMLIEDGHVYLRSTAALRIAARLTWPWSIFRVFLWIPVQIRDLAYRMVAAVRHRLSGPSTACDLPPPEIRARMI